MPAYTWRIATTTSTYVAEDLSGAGAEKTGGRWNRVGKRMVYTASSIALAVLETIVHTGATLPFNRYLVEVSIPDDVWDGRETIDQASAPVGWDACPTGMPSLDYGDDWLASRRSAILLVPSVVVPEEFNILLNPTHPDAAKITARPIRRWAYDYRLRT